MADQKIHLLPTVTPGIARYGLVAGTNGKMYKTFQGPRTFNAADFGVNAANVDNTTQMQSALAAIVSAGGGELRVNWASETYKISGPLITSLNGVNPNCQLYIPLCTISSKLVSIKIIGEAPPNFFSEAVGDVARNIEGVIFESTIVGTGTRPAVFGTPWFNAGVTGNRNYCKVEMENIIVRTRTKSGSTDVVGSMTAINFNNLCAFNAKNIKADITSRLVDSVLPNNNTCGIIYPYKNNKSEVYSEGIVFAEGYTNGIIPGEHSVFNNLLSCGCINALNCTGPNQDYAVTITRFQAEVNHNNMVIDQNIDLTILQYEAEHYLETDKWYQFQKDVKYISGEGYVQIFNCTGGVSFIGKTRDPSLFLVDTDENLQLKIFNGWGQNVAY